MLAAALCRAACATTAANVQSNARAYQCLLCCAVSDAVPIDCQCRPATAQATSCQQHTNISNPETSSWHLSQRHHHVASACSMADPCLPEQRSAQGASCTPPDCAHATRARQHSLTYCHHPEMLTGRQHPKKVPKQGAITLITLSLQNTPHANNHNSA